MSGDDVASPCVRLCTLNEHSVCLGCGRHVDEICAWRSYSDDEKRRVLERAATRRRGFEARYREA
jgi:predicted Fe-S protein YdhL (DUF1289 family)